MLASILCHTPTVLLKNDRSRPRPKRWPSLWRNAHTYYYYYAEESTFSLWSPKIRCLKSDTIIGRPLRSGTLGSQPSCSFALEMSGFLLWGSSSVFGLNSIFAFGSMVSWTTWWTPDKRFIQNKLLFLLKYVQDDWYICYYLCMCTYLSKFKHGEFAWITKIERSDVLSFHQPHQSLNLIIISTVYFPVNTHISY